MTSLEISPELRSSHELLALRGQHRPDHLLVPVRADLDRLQAVAVVVELAGADREPA